MGKVVRLTELDLMRLIKRVINETNQDEKYIFIAKDFKGVRMEFGGESSVTPQSIIELYNEYVEDGTPLVKYLTRTKNRNDVFINEDGEEIDKVTVLDELNYAILGDEYL